MNLPLVAQSLITFSDLSSSTLLKLSQLTLAGCDTQWARALFWDHEGKELHSCRQDTLKAPVATVSILNIPHLNTLLFPAPQTKWLLCREEGCARPADGHMRSQRSIAVVCTLQMMKTLQYSQSQQDDFAPSVFHIVVITRSTEMQIKLQSLQVERYTLLLPLCTDLHFLLPLTHQELRLELQELVACSQQDCSKG
ncbi:hypothetical protein QQF64_035712 [Cirrhinus molitorella]|uniref:Uncharacterized protein n=1 Tax=Cirrhinus molitorella TaxID=172907 RepID=A0ABR3NGI4_9TELE